MNPDTNHRHWYALYTRSRFEAKVGIQLEEKGIEHYLPKRKVLKFWSDRKKWVEEPLFRSYLFVRGNPIERYRAMQAIGVVRVVSFKGVPAVVQDQEIDRLKLILKEKPQAEACDALSIGDLVEIVRGPLAGTEGRLADIRDNCRLVVNIPSIRQAIRFNIDREDVRIIERVAERV